MALIECPECKYQISDKAPNCPKCGAPKISRSSPSPVATNLPKTRRPGKRHTTKIIFVFFVLILGIGYWLWRATTSDEAAPLSAGFFAAFRQPERVVNERAELKEGEFASYFFALRTDARVQVQVSAGPKNVDVMLMTKEEAERLRQSPDNLFGGRYTYREDLSSKQVHAMDRTEVLPKGEWTIVVMRPSEGLLPEKGTSVNIIVTTY